MTKMGKYIVGFWIAILFCACSDIKRQPISPVSYTIVARNYTHAIYNSENRLITHPLDDLFHEIKRRADVGEPPISDVYIISHGWNYTGGLAETNYHNYIGLFDEFMNQPNINNLFQPYLILVTWTSTVRPLTSITNAVMPLNTDEILRPLFSILDRGPIHLMTAWKQAMNAATIALGRDLPDAYLPTAWADEPYGVEETYYGERDTGQDLPLSAVVFEILSAKYPSLKNTKFRNPALEDLGDRIQNCQSEKQIPYLLYLKNKNKSKKLTEVFPQTKFHLVGHSYGAKLVALAGMEGLRRWVLLNYLGYPRGDFKKCDHLSAGDKNIIQKAQREQIELLSSFFTREQDALRVMEAVYEDNDVIQTNGPIESLLMINPAIHPGEFEYPTASLRFASVNTLRLITRKAVVYSLYDRANGWAFNLRDLLLNPQVAQIYQSQLSYSEQRLEDIYGTTAFRSINGIYNGPLALASSLVYGAFFYVYSFLVNTPTDLFYHINNNTFKGMIQSPRQESSALLAGLKRGINSLDYFLPLVPPFPLRQEDEQGILRLNRPGLGKTGLIRAGNGRNKTLSLGSLAQFFDGSRDISPDLVCQFSNKVLADDDGIAPASSKDEIISLDGSRIYDTMWSIAGSHGDLREFEDAQCETSGNIPKRQHTLYLVINFTKMNYLNWLKAANATP
jgi:hypothetical protein